MRALSATRQCFLRRRTSGDGSAPATPAWATARQGSGAFLRPTSAKSAASKSAASTPSDLKAVKEEPAPQQPHTTPAAAQGRQEAAKPPIEPVTSRAAAAEERPVMPGSEERKKPLGEPVICKAAVAEESSVVTESTSGATGAAAADSGTAAPEHATGKENVSVPEENLANGDMSAHEDAARAGKAEPGAEGVLGGAPPASSTPSAAEPDENEPASAESHAAGKPDLAPSVAADKAVNGTLPHAPHTAATAPAPAAATVARPDEVSSFRMERRKRTSSNAAKSGPAADAAAAAALLSTPAVADGTGVL